ncbi:MAG: DUF4388 domain-containing protein [Planctomycetota bacterium]|nr:MAG: DUF4388 domain-containing protein [Planctomycetota bacterium]
MALTGHSQAYALTDIFQFIHANKYNGTLQIEFPHENSTFFVYFRKGDIVLPFEKIKLRDNRLLLNLDLVEEEDLLHAQYFEKKTAISPVGLLLYCSILSPKSVQQLKPCIEENLYLLFEEECQYIFHKNQLPPSAHKEGFQFSSGSIVMEASRRLDHIQKIQQGLENTVYVLQPHLTEKWEGKKGKILQYLQNSLSFDQILTQTDVDKYTFYTTIQQLLDEKKLSPIDPSKGLSKVQELLDRKDILSALVFVQNLPTTFSELYSQAILLISEYLKTHPLKNNAHFFSSGQNLLAFLHQTLKSQLCPLTLQIKQEYRLHLHPKGIAFAKKNTNFSPRLLKKCSSQKKIDPQQNKISPNLPPTELLKTLTQLLSEEEKQQLLETSLLEILAEIYPLDEAEVELLPPSPSPNFPPEFSPLSLSYSPQYPPENFVKNLTELLELLHKLPPQVEIYLTTSKFRSSPPTSEKMRQFLSHFHRNYKNLNSLFSEILQQYPILEAYRLFQTAYKEGYLGPLSVDDTRRFLQTRLAEGKLEEAKRFLTSAQSMGYHQVDEFYTKAAEELELISAYLDESAPSLEGELASFSLAEILQTLVSGQHTGTLTIRSKNRTKDLYFYQGEVYVLRQEVQAKQEVQSLFLETQARIAVQDIFEMDMQGMMTEDQISEELANEVKEEIYEIFLWEEATFRFKKALPEMFLNPTEEYTKLRLKTDEFLMEAISRIDMWTEIMEVVRTEKAIFAFLSPQTKQQALTSGIDPQVLYLIDGTHNMDDIIRISRKRKFEVGGILFDLCQMGYIAPLTQDQLVKLGNEAIERKDYERAHNYYLHLSKLLPENKKVLEMEQLLAKKKKSTQRFPPQKPASP